MTPKLNIQRLVSKNKVEAAFEQPSPFFFFFESFDFVELLLLPLLPLEPELPSSVFFVVRLQSPEPLAAVVAAALGFFEVDFFLSTSKIVIAVILEETSRSSKVMVLSGPAEVVLVSHTAVLPYLQSYSVAPKLTSITVSAYVNVTPLKSPSQSNGPSKLVWQARRYFVVEDDSVITEA